MDNDVNTFLQSQDSCEYIPRPPTLIRYQLNPDLNDRVVYNLHAKKIKEMIADFELTYANKRNAMIYNIYRAWLKRCTNKRLFIVDLANLIYGNNYEDLHFKHDRVTFKYIPFTNREYAISCTLPRKVLNVRTMKLCKICSRSSVYLTVKMWKNNEKLHRLIALTFIPNPQPFINYVVDHIDLNKRNNCINNLRWTSQRINNINTSKRIFADDDTITRLTHITGTYYRDPSTDDIYEYIGNGYAKRSKNNQKLRTL